MHPFLAFLASVWSSRDVLILVHQQGISLEDWSYQQTETLSSRNRPVPCAHVCFVLLYLLFPSFLPFCLFLFFHPSSCSLSFYLVSFSLSGAYIIPWDVFLVFFGCKWFGMVIYHSPLITLILPFPLCTGTAVRRNFVLGCFSPIEKHFLVCDRS